MPIRQGIIGRGVGAVMTMAALFVSAPQAAIAAPMEYSVEMARMRYGEVPTKLKVGDSIVWVNRDTVPHTVTARNRSFDLRIAPGKRAKMILTKSGKIEFYCILHPAMRGSLTVADQ
jgi:plastocyanin